MDFQLTIKILTYLDPVNVSKCQQVVKSNQENLGRYHNVIRMQGSSSHHALEDVVEQAVDVEVAHAGEGNPTCFTTPQHFGVNCVRSKMRLPFNP